jgi:hypothetical protein
MFMDNQNSMEVIGHHNVSAQVVNNHNLAGESTGDDVFVGHI